LCTVYIYKTDASMSEDDMIRETERLMPLLPAWRRQKLDSITHTRARYESAVAGVLYKYAMREYRAADLSVEVGPIGKPEHIGGVPYFSISHSGEYVAIAVAESRVGLDIECKGDAGCRVTDRMFTEREKLYVHGELKCSEKHNTASTEDKKTTDNTDESGILGETSDMRFRDVWTAKEAYLKCIGCGISVPLSSFEVRGGYIQQQEQSEGSDNTPEGPVAGGKESVGEAAKEGRTDGISVYHIWTDRLDDDRYSITVCMEEDISKEIKVDIKYVLDIDRLKCL